YGAEEMAGNTTDPKRDELDLALLRHAAATGKPVLGICRGCQIMNVFRGGSLASHFSDLVETSMEHNQPAHNASSAVHEVILESTSWLHSIVGETRLEVNSLHRQVCDRIGAGLRVSARSEDGLIEAIEDQNDPSRFFGVQWHPECLGDQPSE